MSRDDGGPAFPPTRVYVDPSGRVLDGMTLRDYFAGLAMQSVVSVLHQGIRPADIGLMAHDCYGIADAMLEERAK